MTHAASEERRLPRRVLNIAGASYLAALFMGGPLGFLSRALARSISGRVHASYVLPAEAAFISLGCAYFAALYATLWMTTPEAPCPRAAVLRMQSAAQQMAPPRTLARVSN